MSKISKLYQLDIGVDEKGRYIGQLVVLSEKKGIAYSALSLRVLFPHIKKALLQKDKEMRRFPLPQESLILDPNGNKVLIVQ